MRWEWAQQRTVNLLLAHLEKGRSQYPEIQPGCHDYGMPNSNLQAAEIKIAVISKIVSVASHSGNRGKGFYKISFLTILKKPTIPGSSICNAMTVKRSHPGAMPALECCAIFKMLDCK